MNARLSSSLLEGGPCAAWDLRASFIYSFIYLMYKRRFNASDTWNIDETGVSTVLKPNKILVVKGMRKVRFLTFGEQGINVTIITVVSAYGNTVLPMVVFPRKQFKNLKTTFLMVVPLNVQEQAMAVGGLQTKNSISLCNIL